MGLDAREMTTVVAAAASAPSSFISMLDLCITLETSRGPSAISAKLGLENIPPRPNRAETSGSIQGTKFVFFVCGDNNYYNNLSYPIW